MLTSSTPFDAALLLSCRLLPCLLIVPRRDTLGIPAWSLLGCAAAIVVAVAPLHPAAVTATPHSAAGELLLGCGLALAGLLGLGLLGTLGGFSDEAGGHRSPLWRQHLPMLTLAVWALSGGAAALVGGLDESLRLLPLGSAAERLLSGPHELLAAMPDIALSGALLCLPVALLRLLAELGDGLAARWTGHRTAAARPLLPLGIGLLFLLAISQLTTSRFVMGP